MLPPLVFVFTKRFCLALQRRDREKLLHGYETGTIVRLPSGEFIEVHAPVSDEERAMLLAGETYHPLELDDGPDENGVRPKITMLHRARSRLSHFYFGEQIQRPTAEELAASEHHAHELAQSYARQLESGSAAEDDVRALSVRTIPAARARRSCSPCSSCAPSPRHRGASPSPAS